MPKKTNPRKIPCSKADVDKAMEQGSETAQKISIFVLRNYFGFSDSDIEKYCRKFNDTLDSITSKYISTKDIEDALMDEYKTRISVY